MNKILVICFLIFFGCEDTKISNCERNNVKNQNFFTVSYNGYDKKECIRSIYLFGGDYHKVVFKGTDGKYYATKYAYQVNQSNMIATPLRPLTLWFETWHRTDLINIYRAVDNFVIPATKKISNYRNYMCYGNLVAGVFTKEQYEKFIKIHFYTQILNY